MIYLKDLKEGDICVFSPLSSIYFKVLLPYDGFTCKLLNLRTNSILFRYCNVRVFPVQLNLFDYFFE